MSLFNLGGMTATQLNELRVERLYNNDKTITFIDQSGGWVYAEDNGFYLASDKLRGGETVATKDEIKIPPMKIAIGNAGKLYRNEDVLVLDLNNAASWASNETSFATAANRAGVDFYVYAVEPDTGYSCEFVISENTTFPNGVNAGGTTHTDQNTRKIGGFHGLCATVGTATQSYGGNFTADAHPYYNYTVGNVLKTSVWDKFKHRPIAEPEGMVYCEELGIWVDIYAASHAIAPTAGVPSDSIQSKFNTGITVSRSQMDFQDDFVRLKKRLPSDQEFSALAFGTAEESDLNGVSPVATGSGGHTATRGNLVRMISYCGAEGCAGAGWQWLETSTVYSNAGTDGWQNYSTKGSWYSAGNMALYVLFAGGSWLNSSEAGSRSRHSHVLRSLVRGDGGARGVSDSMLNY